MTLASGSNLADFAAAVEWSELPQEVRAKTLDHVLDTVGTMFAGVEVDACAAARKAAAAWGRSEEATVIGIDPMYPVPTAAFLNALHGRINAYDDTYEPGNVHPGNSVIAAALALSEKHAADATTFLAAVVAGYEVVTRIAAAVSPSHYAAGFHSTGTCTVFGAAAAAARILRLSGTATAEVLGLAGATAAGLRQHQLDGSMLDSAFHGARAAQSGVMVAQLRAEGLRGPAGILDGPMGFCAVMAPAHDTTRLDAQLGVRYEFMHSTIKPYPTAFFVHGPIETALELKRRHQLDAIQIRRVEIATFKQSIEVSDRPQVRTPYDAMVGHQYGVAVALVKNKVALAAFSQAALADAAVLQLMEKIHVIHDPAFEHLFPHSCPHRVTITLTDGREFSMLSEYPPGWLAPIPQSIVDGKFLDHCSARLGSSRARQLLPLIRGLQDCPDLRGLIRTLKPAMASSCAAAARR
jgi:2-methylcitrate dehydratase PrpD